MNEFFIPLVAFFVVLVNILDFLDHKFLGGVLRFVDKAAIAFVIGTILCVVISCLVRPSEKEQDSNQEKIV